MVNDFEANTTAVPRDDRLETCSHSLILFGPSGIILGPVALTIITPLLEIWRSRTTPEAVVLGV